MAKTAIAGIVTPDVLSAAQVPADMLTMARSIEPGLLPRFATVADRSAAFNSTVLGQDPFGGEGLRCYMIDSGIWVYDGGGWVPGEGTRIITSYTAAAGQTAGLAANSGVTYVAGINGAGAITLRRRRLIEVHATFVLRCDTANTQYRLHVYEAAGDLIDRRGNFDLPDGPGAQWEPLRSLPLAMGVGDHNIGCTVSITSGSGTIIISALTITVLDVGAA